MFLVDDNSKSDPMQNTMKFQPWPLGLHTFLDFCQFVIGVFLHTFQFCANGLLETLQVLQYCVCALFFRVIEVLEVPFETFADAFQVFQNSIQNISIVNPFHFRGIRWYEV